jgi:hypothetical protein
MNNSKLTWQAVVLLAVLGGIACALAVWSPWTSSEILALIGILGGLATGAAVGGAVAGNVSNRIDQVATETQQQTATLETVAKRVNGELDARIGAAMEEAAEMGAGRVLHVLRQEGVIRGG